MAYKMEVTNHLLTGMILQANQLTSFEFMLAEPAKPPSPFPCRVTVGWKKSKLPEVIGIPAEQVGYPSPSL